MNKLESLIQYVQSDGRVCPMPDYWNKLWEMLPERKRKGNGWEPSLPLILAAWDDTPAMLKTIRLEEHLRWADAHGAIEKVSVFLRGLNETDWFHIDD